MEAQIIADLGNAIGQLRHLQQHRKRAADRSARSGDSRPDRLSFRRHVLLLRIGQACHLILPTNKESECGKSSRPILAQAACYARFGHH
jgi:hypothetical protein